MRILSLLQFQVISLFLTILYFIITSHNLPLFKSCLMSTFFGQAIEENQQLKIDFKHATQKPQEWYLQLTHVALDVNSNVSHLYLKLQNKELLLLELNRNHPPLFATVNIHIYPSDSPTLVAKSGKMHASGYFCKKYEQKNKSLQKEASQVLTLEQQKSKKITGSLQQLTKKINKQEQQENICTSTRSSHSRRAKQAAVEKNATQIKKLPEIKNHRQFFMTKTVVSTQSPINKKTNKRHNIKDKKQLLDDKKQVKRSSLSMLIKQAEQQDDSDQEDSDQSFDESQQSDDDDEFQDDDQDQTPPAKHTQKSQKTKQKKGEQKEQKSKSTEIEISQQPQDQNQKRGQNEKILKVWPGMGRIRLTRQQMEKVDFSQWTNLIKAPTKKPSFL